MKRAENGDRVIVHYIGTLDNGRIFDTRDDDSPLEFTLGNHEVFPALENEIIGMKPGSVKNIQVQAEDAFGLRREENILTIERALLPAAPDIRTGQKLSVEFRDGASRVMLVTHVERDRVTLDGNHALAGHDLTFALKLVEIRS